MAVPTNSGHGKKGWGRGGDNLVSMLGMGGMDNFDLLGSLDRQLWCGLPL